MIVPGRKPDMEIGVGLEGYFEVELIDARTGLVKRRLEFHNVIVNGGMDALGDGTGTIDSMVDNLAVGTGSTAPAQTDTSLEVEVARTNQADDFSTSGPNFDYSELISEYEFAKSEANANLTELGCFNQNSGGVMYNRQLFRDAQGNPTTITKTSDDILKVRYIHRMYPDKVVKTKDVDLDIRGTPVTTTISHQPQEIDDGGIWLAGGINGLGLHLGSWGGQSPEWFEDNTPPGDFISHGPLDPSTSERGGSVSAQAYVGGNFYRDIDLLAGDADANFPTGIGSVAWTPLPSSQTTNNDQAFLLLFDPKVDKSAQDEFTFTVRLSWSRVAV